MSGPSHWQARRVGPIYDSAEVQDHAISESHDDCQWHTGKAAYASSDVTSLESSSLSSDLQLQVTFRLLSSSSLSARVFEMTQLDSSLDYTE